MLKPWIFIFCSGQSIGKIKKNDIFCTLFIDSKFRHNNGLLVATQNNYSNKYSTREPGHQTCLHNSKPVQAIRVPMNCQTPIQNHLSSEHFNYHTRLMVSPEVPPLLAMVSMVHGAFYSFNDVSIVNVSFFSESGNKYTTWPSSIVPFEFLYSFQKWFFFHCHSSDGVDVLKDERTQTRKKKHSPHPKEDYRATYVGYLQSE